MKTPEDRVLGDISALQQLSRINALSQQSATCLHQGNLDKAEELAQAILNEIPNHADANYLLGSIASERDEFDLAARYLARAIEINPGLDKYHIAHASALHKHGQLEAAVAAYKQAIQINPDNAEAHNNLGIALAALGQPGAAIAACREAARLKPGYAEAYINLGLALRDQACLEEALVVLEQALQLKPELAEAHSSRGSVFMAMGRLAAAAEDYRHALQLVPDSARIHSNLLFLEAAAARLPPAALLAEQQAWDRVQGAAGRREPLPARPREALAGRRLRVGYVSPDLRGHAVSYFFAPLLAAHDRARVEVFCYATHNRAFSDATTARLQGLAEHWRFVVDLSDAGLARLIHDDGVDILVDLAGHTGGNRLPVFSYRPAPVQATWLGFFAGTGLSAMDYWITDAVLHPADTPEQAVEQIWRLPRCWVCYEPPAVAPPVAPCPHTDARVVFGSFSNLSKLTDAVIETWSALLQALPESQLLLMDKPLAEAATRERLLGRFAAHGIPGSRLLLQPGAPLKDYLGTYAKVDIVLDPFPRTGGTTTAEALWMGVPVVTLAGARYVERISAAKLAALGLEELVTHTREQYLATAEALARDPARRAKLRATLRETMARSPLCDGKGLAQAMEATYQEMWERFVAENAGK